MIERYILLGIVVVCLLGLVAIVWGALWGAGAGEEDWRDDE